MKKSTLFIIAIIILAGLIRLPALDKYPAGLNADEAAIGYNDYSLLQTGKDEHGASWPLVFRSFDDYKPPVYFYLALPFVKFMGPTVWAVRLPSAILGILSIYLIYLLVLEIFADEKHGRLLALLSALMLTVSPWHIHFSRGGWEVNASLFFILLGLIGLFKALKGRVGYLFLFGISSVIAMYTYHSTRIVLPLLSISIVIVYFKDFFKLFSKKNYKTTLVALVVSLVLILPLAGQMLSKQGQARFSGVSVFSDQGPLWQALQLRREHGAESGSLYVKLIHNRYLSYTLRFTKNYLSHYSPRFLFITGDEIARSKVPGMGQSLLFLLPFYAIGILALLRLDSKGKKIFLLWFLFAPLAAALTFQSPHALRAQNMSVPLAVITALGVMAVYLYIEKYSKHIVRLLICLFFVGLAYDFGYYLHEYYLHYPKELPYAWQYGFDQIASYVKQNYSKYDHIIITDRYDQPYILMAFYLQYPPAKLQSQLVMTPRDKFGFSTVREFDKFQFRKINFDQDRKIKNALIISADEPVDQKNVIYTINDPGGKPMYHFSVSDN